MASSKVLLKNNQVEAVYKFANDSSTPVSFTVTMAELARADQVISGTAGATISTLTYCTTDGIAISRNSVLQWFLIGDSEFPNASAADNQNSTHTITVEIATGTLIMRLLKNSAFKDA